MIICAWAFILLGAGFLIGGLTLVGMWSNAPREWPEGTGGDIGSVVTNAVLGEAALFGFMGLILIGIGVWALRELNRQRKEMQKSK